MKSRFHACLIAALAAYALPAAAQPAPGERFAVSGAIGASRPQDAAMSSVYGSRLMPVTAQFDVRAAANLWVFGGVKWTRADGHTVVLGTPVADEPAYVTSFRVMSYRFGALASLAATPRWSFGLGGGLCVAPYEETWREAGLAISDRTTGFVAIGEARYRATARWSVVGRAEYTTLPAAVGDVRVNLGSLDASAGLRFSF